VIQTRNEEQARHNSAPTAESSAKARGARKAVRREVEKAIEKWIDERVQVVNTLQARCERQADPKMIWGLILELTVGPRKVNTEETMELKRK